MKPTPRRRSVSRATVGETPIARDFFAGQYAKVAAATFDAPAMDTTPEDVAFAVGALTFLGRVPEAEICFDGFRLGPGPHDARTATASRFFLGLAHARAGDFARAHELLVARARTRLAERDPWMRALTLQGLACYRYFTGKFRAAARHALRALRAAHAARFAYAQMLSTDLRGHALVQLGQFQAGSALLEQAQSHAERLDFGLNAYAIACSRVVYKARFKVGPDVLADLEAQLAVKAHDFYSRRTVLTQAAVQYALRGRGGDALAALAEVDRDALRADARRARVTSLIGRLQVTRWTRGLDACAALLEDAVALVDEKDVAFRAELHAFEALVGEATGDATRRERALSALRGLAGRAEHVAPRAALAQVGGDRPLPFAEDELSPLLRAVNRRDERELPRLLALGLLGPIPELFGLSPGRRLHLLSTENAVLVEDHGDLWLRRAPRAGCRPCFACSRPGARRRRPSSPGCGACVATDPSGTIRWCAPPSTACAPSWSRAASG